MSGCDSIQGGILVRELTSWAEFSKMVASELLDKPALIYRGQPDSTWPILSTLDRYEKRFPTTSFTINGVKHTAKVPPPQNRPTHLKAFQLAVLNKRGLNPPELSEDEWWALAQHHGLATPMIDWALSPFVALFFAFEGKLCCDRANSRLYEPPARAVFALSSSCISEHDSENDPAPRPYMPAKETSYRVASQSGILLKMPRGIDLEGYVRGHFGKETSSDTTNARAILTKYVIPNAGRIECLKLLNKMNVNRMTLFPDIDGAAQYINALWELDFDTSLGFLPTKLG